MMGSPTSLAKGTGNSRRPRRHERSSRPRPPRRRCRASRMLRRPRRQAQARDRSARRRLHLPDAPGDPAGRARAAARSAAWRWSRVEVTAEAAPNPELADMTRRFWVGAGADRAGRSSWRWAATFRASACTTSCRRGSRPGCSSLLATPVVLWAGWPFFQRGWASVVQPQPQHVHPDRARHRRGLRLQRGRHPRPRRLPGRASAAWTARSRSTSRPRRSSPCWCCSGRCWSCARASRPAAPSAPC